MPRYNMNTFLNAVIAKSRNTKYLKWYLSIVSSALGRDNITGYVEQHHIFPKGMGGNNNCENIVILTAREHFICHLLLSKMVILSVDRKKMVYALLMLSKCNNQNQQRRISSSTYERIKKDLSVLSSGENNHFFGKTHTADSRKKIGEKSKGRIPSQDTRKKMSDSHVGRPPNLEAAKRGALTRIANGNNRHTEQTKMTISLSRLGSKTGVPAWNAGKTKETNESVKKISDSKVGKEPWNKGVVGTDDSRICMGSRNGFYNKTHSEATLKVMTEKAQNRQRYECGHCKKILTKANLTRWHNDNCKDKCQ